MCIYSVQLYSQFIASNTFWIDTRCESQPSIQVSNILDFSNLNASIDTQNLSLLICFLVRMSIWQTIWNDTSFSTWMLLVSCHSWNFTCRYSIVPLPRIAAALCAPPSKTLFVCSAANDPSVYQSIFTITEKAFSCLKAPTSTFTIFTFKALLRHYAKRALTPW